MFILIRKMQIETYIVEIHDIHERGCRAIVEIGRAPGQATKNRAFDLADMIESAIDQGLAEIGRGFALVGRLTRGRVLSAHGDLWQVAYIQAT